jgi:hypothetical protein
MILDSMGISMMDTGQIFLMEQALCRDFYSKTSPDLILPDGSVPEASCKLESVQAQLAFLFGCYNISSLLPSK